jgi:hypothetical protein
MKPRPDLIHDQALLLKAFLAGQRIQGIGEMAIQAVSTRLEGHQILGARVLQRCAAREAVPALREVLLRQSKVHGGGFQLRSAVLDALQACVSAKDARWILDECFDTTRPLHGVAMRLAGRLPRRAVTSRLLVECESPSSARRQTAAELVRGLPPDARRPFLAILRKDSEPAVRAVLGLP